MDKRKPFKPMTRSTINSSTTDNNASKATPELPEGPGYKPYSPLRTKLFEARIPGEKLTLTGIVLDMNGKPFVHAWMDFWQANGQGEYDNSGYTFRGHQYTDESGKYILDNFRLASFKG